MIGYNHQMTPGETMYELEKRPAHPTDAASVVTWFPTRTEALLWGGPNVPDPLTSPWLEQEFQKHKYWVWVDRTGAIQGVFALVLRDEGLLRLARFALSPSLRGQRLSKRLVEETIALARSLGAKRMSLAVYGSNRIARHVYDSVGFRVFEERIAQENPSVVSYEMRLDF